MTGHRRTLQEELDELQRRLDSGELSPEEEDEFRARLAAIKAELEALDARLAAGLSGADAAENADGQDGDADGPVKEGFRRVRGEDGRWVQIADARYDPGAVYASGAGGPSTGLWVYTQDSKETDEERRRRLSGGVRPQDSAGFMMLDPRTPEPDPLSLALSTRQAVLTNAPLGRWRRGGAQGDAGALGSLLRRQQPVAAAERAVPVGRRDAGRASAPGEPADRG